jgi:hypothetical protein
MGFHIPILRPFAQQQKRLKSLKKEAIKQQSQKL